MAISAGVAAAGLIGGSALAGGMAASKENKQANKAAAQQVRGINEAQDITQAATDRALTYGEPIIARGFNAERPLDTAINQGYQQGNVGNQQNLDAYNKLNTLGYGPLNVNQYLDPSIQYAQQNAQKTIERSAAARGGLLSGATLQDLMQKAGEIATGNYNNAATLALQDKNQNASLIQQQRGIAETNLNQAQNAMNQGRLDVNAGNAATINQANIVNDAGIAQGNLAIGVGNSQAAASASQKSALGGALGAGAGMVGGLANSKIGASLFSDVFSDERVKYDVDSVTDEELDEFLEKLNPKSFKYKDKAKDKGAPQGKQTGIIAQDLEKSKVGKRLVKEDQQGIKKVDVPMTVSTLLATAANTNKRLQKLEGK